MKYFVTSKRDGSREEISKSEALRLLKANYVERVCTFEEMLEMENTYPCMFNVLEVKGE